MEAAGRGSRMAGQPQVKKSRNTSGSPKECPVCLTGYDGTVQRPRTLPCGHTLCTLCIDKLKKYGCVACPECCVNHAVPKGGQFPVNFAVEAFMRDSEVAAAASLPPRAWKEEGAAAAAASLPPRAWKEEGGTAAAAASPPPRAWKEQRGTAAAAAASPSPSAGKGAAGVKKEAVGLSKGMHYNLQKQAATVVAAITACREAQSQLDQYLTTLAGWGKRQRQLEQRLGSLVVQSRSARALVQKEAFQVSAKKKKVKEEEQRLQAMLETLHTLTTEQEVDAAVTKVFRCTGEAERALKEWRERFPDAGTVTTMRKVQEASSTALEAAQAALEAVPAVTTEELWPQSDPHSTVMDRLHLTLTGSLKVEDLHSLTQPARRLLEAGRVFAVHQVEGRRRHARISLEAGKLCLHALKDLPPPRGAATLQVREVVPPSPPCTVFLDLSWPGSAPRRVHISLSPDTPRGRQFLLLCTGQSGPSYVNTRLYEVKRWRDTGENVKGGHYMSNDGHWTSAMLPGLGKSSVGYLGPNHAGDVFGLKPSGQCGLFGIFTSDRQSSGSSTHSLFGKVVDGLHVVAEAAKHSDIEEVTVVDCGVVLRVMATTTTARP